MTNQFVKRGMGWIPDLPDWRDYTFDQPEIVSFLTSGQESNKQAHQTLRRESFQLAPEEGCFIEAENQGTLNCSSVFAVLGAIQLVEQCNYGRCFEPSARFLYQTALQSLGRDGDHGIGIRETLKALRRFGVPPEHLYPYITDEIHHNSLDSYLYSYVKDFESLVYFRLDRRYVSSMQVASLPCDGKETLEHIISFIAAGLPVVLGFSVPCSLKNDSKIPFHQTSRVRGGQAVIAVGYDQCSSMLSIRSSWGNKWGDSGYGLLPYQYVESGLAADVWCVLKKEWLQNQERNSDFNWLHTEMLPEGIVQSDESDR